MRQLLSLIDLLLLDTKMLNTIKHFSKILFLIRKSPYGTSHIKEAIDAILAALTLDITVTVIFIDDGVWQLKSQQQSAALQEKNFTATFKALPEFGNITLYVESESLIRHDLVITDLFLPIKEINRNTLNQLFSEQDLLLTF